MTSARRVSFSERNEYSRLPRDDEMYVLKAFSRHAKKCSSCYDPFRVYREGGTLCPKGHQRALDVAQYVYNKGGVAYSVVDGEKSQRVQIEIPSECEAVRSLLKAMERGLRVMKRAPTVSYDKGYYVPARRASDRGPAPTRRPSTNNLRLETVEPPRSPRPRHTRSQSYNTYKTSSRSPSPKLNSSRPGLSRYNTYDSNVPRGSRNNSYSSASSRDASPFSSRNNSLSSQSSYGSWSGPSSRKNSLSQPQSQPQPVPMLRRTPKDNDVRGHRYSKSSPPKTGGYYTSSSYPPPLTLTGSAPKEYNNKGLALYRRRDSSEERERERERDSRRSYTNVKPTSTFYRFKREPSPPVPPKDEYVYVRRR
ncbi:hypothetical protein MMC10_001711 [Thelotrema lepadinum]|nr:hypothetical protein [Thelotrema lepadinum]